MRAGGRAGLVVTAAMVLGSVVGLAAPPAEAAAKPRLRVLDATVTEGTGGQAIVAFAVQLSKPARKALHFTWGTRAGTATRGADYTRVRSGARATIAKGRTSTVLLVRVAADAIDEPTESFKVHIAGAPSWVRVVDANATARILDDDPKPWLKVPQPHVVEGAPGKTATTRRLEVRLSRPSGRTVSVYYTVASGSAKLGTDLKRTTKPVRVTFKPGRTSVKLRLGVFGDTKPEKNKRFRLMWSHPKNVRLKAKVTYIQLLDNDRPPKILSITPAGPSPVAAPLVQGIAPDGSTVHVYLSADCSGTQIGQGSAAAFNGSGITATLPITALNTSNSLSVKATGTPWGTSVCSAPVTYVHDDQAPVDPTLTVSPPDPVISDVTPTVSGSAEAGSTVAVYLDTPCSTVALPQTPVTSLTSAQYAAGYTLAALADGSHTVRVTATDTAGNVSGCVSQTFTVDTTGPGVAGLALVGTSPIGDSTPAFTGTVESGSTVDLFVDATSCNGTADATGSAAQFTGSGISLTSSLGDGAHTVRAQATDGVGNPGTCTAPVSFTVDTTQPSPPDSMAVVGGSPSSDATPSITGTAEAGSTVRLYLSSTCSGPVDVSGTAAAFGAGGLTLSDQSGDEHTVTVGATATDDAGNASDCQSFTFTVDTVAAAPMLNPIADGTDPYAPLLTGTAEAGEQVTVFGGASCAGTVVGTLSASDLGSSGLALGVFNVGGPYTFSASAVDSLDNQSSCSAAVSFNVA